MLDLERTETNVYGGLTQGFEQIDNFSKALVTDDKVDEEENDYSGEVMLVGAEAEGNIIMINSQDSSDGDLRIIDHKQGQGQPRQFIKSEAHVKGEMLNPEDMEFDSEFSEFNYGYAEKQRKEMFKQIFNKEKQRAAAGDLNAIPNPGMELYQPPVLNMTPAIPSPYQQGIGQQSITQFAVAQPKPIEVASNLKAEWYCDTTHFPHEFATPEEALTKYNQLGLQLKMQYRHFSMRKNDKGFTTQFWLSCYRKRPSANTTSAKPQGQGVKIKPNQVDVSHDCPVIVKFRWSTDRMSYVRLKHNNKLTHALMHHNHPLELKDKHYLVNDPLIMKELDLFVKCKLSVANIFQIIKKKYKIKIRYQDVYNRVSQIKKEFGLKEVNIFKDRPQTQYEMFLELLKEQQEKYIHQFESPQLTTDALGLYPKKYKMSWAMQLDSEYQLAGGMRSCPKLENIANFILVLPIMKEAYRRFPDLVFIDTSLKHKIPISSAQNYQGFGARIRAHFSSVVRNKF